MIVIIILINLIHLIWSILAHIILAISIMLKPKSIDISPPILEDNS